MDANTTPDTIFVLTGRGTEMMLSEGGSQAWVIDRKRAEKCEYVVCIQNHKQKHFPKGQLSAPHHTAFVVGQLAGFTKADPETDRFGTRKKLVFSGYAEITLPDAWPGHRNPVYYGTLEEMGIDPDALDFKPMPASNVVSSKSARGIQPLTIAQAKAGLALTFGIKPADVEITIRS